MRVLGNLAINFLYVPNNQLRENLGNIKNALCVYLLL